MYYTLMCHYNRRCVVANFKYAPFVDIDHYLRGIIGNVISSFIRSASVC